MSNLIFIVPISLCVGLALPLGALAAGNEAKGTLSY